MATIQLYQFFVVDIDDRTVTGGSLSTAKSITIVDNEIVQQTFKVGPATAVKIFDVAENEAMGNFDFLWLETDLDVLVQFTASAGVSDVYDTKELKGSGTANTMGPALVLGSDDTQLLDGAIDAFTGTADTVDEIWIYNESATETARVHLVVAT
jgi:hypothetical protein